MKENVNITGYLKLVFHENYKKIILTDTRINLDK